MILVPSEVKKTMEQAFLDCDEHLKGESFDTQLSGSTVCTVLFDGTRVYCANAGDSRAIKVKLTSAEKEETEVEVVAQPMSTDHKLEIEEEA